MPWCNSPARSMLRVSYRQPFALKFSHRQRNIRPFSLSLPRNNANSPHKASGTQSPTSQEDTPPDTMRFTVNMDLDALRNRLRERTSSFSSAATQSFAEIGGRLNKITGYDHIEDLKRKVIETEAALGAKRQASRDAKAAYEAAVTRRSSSQREVNDLLQRKSSWTDSDVNRFTALVRQDHLHEQEEARAKSQAALAEAEVEIELNELTRTILNRYHEEQVWSDKIRSVSTYGSLLALGVNITVFILAILVVEPWKRRRLAQTFEKRIEELSLENRAMLDQGMNDLVRHLGTQEHILAQLATASTHEAPVYHTAQVEDEEPGVVSTRPIDKTAKSVRDRELWIAGVAGVFGGSILTLALSYFR